MNQLGNKVIQGTDGRVWLNDKRLANAKKFEAKASINWSEINVNGEYASQYVFNGYSIAGTLVLHKIDSEVLIQYRDCLKTGIAPDIKIVSLERRKDGKTERVVVYGVVFDEVMLSAWENAKEGEISIPFKACGLDILDVIED